MYSTISKKLIKQSIKQIVFILIIVLLLLSPTAIARDSKSDLYIDQISLLIGGNTHRISVTIGNNSNVFPEKDVEIRISIFNIKNTPPVLIKELNLKCSYEELGPNKKHTFRQQIKTEAGKLKLTVVIDPLNKINESNKTNNLKEKIFEIKREKSNLTENKCNLAVGKLYVVPYSGGKVSLRIHILNKGSGYPDNDFFIQLSWNPSYGDDRNRWNRKAKSHPPGSEVILSSSLITIPAEAKKIVFEVVIDIQNKVTETTREDNKKKLEYITGK